MKMLCLIAVVALAIIAPTHAGQINGRDARTSKWDILLTCAKPRKPSFTVFSRESYNIAVTEYNAYLERAKQYAACVRREADADAAALKRAVDEGANRLVQDMTTETNNANAELELLLLRLRQR